jgi:hypothetical protein
MNPNQDFNRLYKDVSSSIAAAMRDISGINIEHKDGKQELSNMIERFRAIRARFDGELEQLEKHAEWDKFTLAFFGETNAGKSTIIESLRILFNEDSRRQLLAQNDQDLVKFEEVLTEHANQVRWGLNRVYAEYAAEITEIKHSAATLTGVLRAESSVRVRRNLWLTFFGGSVFGIAMSFAALYQFLVL